MKLYLNVPNFLFVTSYIQDQYKKDLLLIESLTPVKKGERVSYYKGNVNINVDNSTSFKHDYKKVLAFKNAYESIISYLIANGAFSVLQLNNNIYIPKGFLFIVNVIDDTFKELDGPSETRLTSTWVVKEDTEDTPKEAA